MSNIIFEGRPPFDLPIAQSAGARSLDDIVEVTLNVIAPEVRAEPIPIRVRLTTTTADYLRAQLQASVIAAGQFARSKNR